MTPGESRAPHGRPTEGSSCPSSGQLPSKPVKSRKTVKFHRAVTGPAVAIVAVVAGTVGAWSASTAGQPAAVARPAGSSGRCRSSRPVPGLSPGSSDGRRLSLTPSWPPDRRRPATSSWSPEARQGGRGPRGPRGRSPSGCCTASTGRSGSSGTWIRSGPERAAGTSAPRTRTQVPTASPRRFLARRWHPPGGAGGPVPGPRSCGACATSSRGTARLRPPGRTS